MSTLNELATTYNEIFNFCGYLALSPCLETYKFFAGADHQNLFLGVGACVFFSTFVPILPEVMSFTFAAASFLVALSLVVGIVAFPLAILIDLADDNAFHSQSQPCGL